MNTLSCTLHYQPDKLHTHTQSKILDISKAHFDHCAIAIPHMMHLSASCSNDSQHQTCKMHTACNQVHQLSAVFSKYANSPNNAKQSAPGTNCNCDLMVHTRFCHALTCYACTVQYCLSKSVQCHYCV